MWVLIFMLLKLVSFIFSVEVVVFVFSFVICLIEVFVVGGRWILFGIGMIVEMCLEGIVRLMVLVVIWFGLVFFMMLSVMLICVKIGMLWWWILLVRWWKLVMWLGRFICNMLDCFMLCVFSFVVIVLFMMISFRLEVVCFLKNVSVLLLGCLFLVFECLKMGFMISWFFKVSWLSLSGWKRGLWLFSIICFFVFWCLDVKFCEGFWGEYFFDCELVVWEFLFMVVVGEGFDYVLVFVDVIGLLFWFYCGDCVFYCGDLLG